MKKDFADCLGLIKSDKIRKFVEHALGEAPPQFWIAPSSSFNKYHPLEDQVEGGIIVHSRKAVQVAISLFKFFEIEEQLAKDKIIAACILHDIQKNGIPWDKRTADDHGWVASRWLMKIAKAGQQNVDTDFVEIAIMVAYHMGVWNKPPTAAHGNPMYLIVQLADYWASRKWCPFVCDEFFQD